MSKMGVARLSLMLLLAAVQLQFNHVDAYSKYGRGCADIGCLPNEECIITSDSCSYSQRDGKDCGNYPTCKRKSGSSTNQANPSSSSSSSVNPSGSSLNTGPESKIYAPASSNPTLNTYTYFNHNNNNHNANKNNHINGHPNGNQQQSSNAQQNGGHAGQQNGGGYVGQQNGGQGGGGGNQNVANVEGTNGAAGASATGIDPHYVFGAKYHMPIIPNMPIFPYNSPTQAPSFQQFPQPNHPGSVLNPGYPMHNQQPMNPFVFGQLPFYSGPAGTGGPPGGGGGMGMPSSSIGVLGGGGGGLAPYGSNFQGYQTHHQNANMFNKPPPQYQNQNQQNPYNRQTQAHPSAAGQLKSFNAPLIGVIAVLALLLANRVIGST